MTVASLTAQDRFATAALLDASPESGAPIAALREVIVDVVSGSYKSYETEAACDHFGIPEREDAWAYNSKRVYARNRLTGLQLPGMLEIARRVLDEHPDEELANMVLGTGLRGVDGELKTLIFAADGATPRIVLADAVSNTIDIVDGADRCLVYDRPLTTAGLTWGELLDWWTATKRPRVSAGRTAGQALYGRLARSLTSAAETLLFRSYCERGGKRGKATLPALIPHVCLHYDPQTAWELATIDGGELVRRRMDFLLLPPGHRRIVVEVDDTDRYTEHPNTTREQPSPRLYSELVAEDRRIQMAGYEVFRFGGYELTQPGGADVVRSVFDTLLG